MSLYNYPLYYDVAFDRDVIPEIEFLETCMALWSDRPARRVLELGCGPAYHTIALAERGYHAVGMDFNETMLDYTIKKAIAQNSTAAFVHGDMCSFSLPSPVDLAICMMATATLIRSLDDMVSHLKSVASNLRSGGLYIMEMLHPREVLIGPAATEAPLEWEARRGDVSVHMRWGKDCDPVDPIEGIRSCEVTAVVTEPGRSQTIVFEEYQALWTRKEIDAAVRLAGGLEVVAWYGALDIHQIFNNSKWSWRMIPVMRKPLPEVAADS